MAERAEVTREHRLAAFRALDHDGRADEPHPDSAIGRWLDGKADAVTHRFMLADSRVAEAIADSEARGRAEYLPTLQAIASALYGREPSESLVFDSEGLAKDVAEMRRELAELRSQANEYGRHPFPTVASAELEADLTIVREALPIAQVNLGTGAVYDPFRSLSRIAAALGLGSGK